MSIDTQDDGLTPTQVNSLRDAAVLLEDSNVDLAYELMTMAHRLRPDGPFINKRLTNYRKRRAEDQKKLQEMIASGELAIIPCGFRCHTKANMAKSLNVKQSSLPFDSGFFPPSSIARILSSRRIELTFPDPKMETHAVCIKQEKVNIGDRHGIEFRSSTYENINELAQVCDQKNINNLLDSTFGFYTLDKVNQFVLAHYNWHKFADKEISAGMIEPSQNIPKINAMMNKRLERMFDMCNAARQVVFIVGEFQKFDFMSIDGVMHDLLDMKTIQNALVKHIGNHALALHFSEVDSASKLLKRIE